MSSLFDVCLSSIFCDVQLKIWNSFLFFRFWYKNPQCWVSPCVCVWLCETVLLVENRSTGGVFWKGGVVYFRESGRVCDVGSCGMWSGVC